MNPVQQTVLYEKAMDLDFMEEVYAIPGADAIKRCIQCGTCSGSCPVSWAMEESPRQIIAMIRAGMRDQVLDSTAIWTCASCYSCYVRCPQEIKITDIMYILKRLAIRENRQQSRQAQALSRIFVEIVNKHGRNHETALMSRYMLSANPGGMFKAAPIGMKLLAHGRLPISGSAVRDIDGLRRIVAKAVQLGRGEE
jgi:heterodisulfide reductase subunit C